MGMMMEAKISELIQQESFARQKSFPGMVMLNHASWLMGATKQTGATELTGAICSVAKLSSLLTGLGG